MNEQFRVAQKIGLMFRPGTAIPKDIKAWALSQLHANSPALGISGRLGKVKPYPKSLEPSLELRVELHRKHRTAREEIDEKLRAMAVLKKRLQEILLMNYILGHFAWMS
jgi:hypothetical protein